MANMTVGVPLTRMSPGDAVALTEEIGATVKEAMAKFGADRVTAQVMSTAEQLQSYTKPLADLIVAPYTERREVDNVADRIIGYLYNTCDSLTQAYEQNLISLTPEQQTRWQAARDLCATLFPDGVGFLKSRWSDQYGITGMMLQRAARPENQTRIQVLGMKQDFDLLEKVHRLYGERMGFTNVQPEGDQDPLADWHEALEAYLCGVMSSHRRSSELRQYLTAPYERMIERIRGAAQRRAQTGGTASAASSTATPSTTSATSSSDSN